MVSEALVIKGLEKDGRFSLAIFTTIPQVFDQLEKLGSQDALDMLADHGGLLPADRMAFVREKSDLILKGKPF